MSSTSIRAKKEQYFVLAFLSLLFFSYIIVSCKGGTGVAFPSPKASAWCTYNISFTEGTSDADMEKQKAELEQSLKDGSKSTDSDINCETTAEWSTIDKYHYQLELRINCFKTGDTTPVRPPAGTRPPPGRVAGGTVDQSGCGDEKQSQSTN